MTNYRLREEFRDKLKEIAVISNRCAWASGLNLSILKRIPRTIPDIETCEVINNFGITLSLLGLISTLNTDS